MEDGESGGESEHERWPVGFIVFVLAAAAYLVLRFIQMGAWLLERITGP